MNTNLALKNNMQLYETINTVETFTPDDIKRGKELFELYKQVGIIVGSTFDDGHWQMYDEYSNITLTFNFSSVNYKRIYEEIFGIRLDAFIEYLKVYIVLNMGKTVLVTLQKIVHDVKKLIRNDFQKIERTEHFLNNPNHIAEFIEMLLDTGEERGEELLTFCEQCAEINLMLRPDNRRILADFISYFKFNDYMKKYWNSIISEEERLFYYPVYLWWSITAIIPLRPREFILTPRNCISRQEGVSFIFLRRNRLKGSTGRVNYNIAQDYVIVKYQIPEKLAEEIDEYIKLTEKYENNTTNTLFRAEPHYAMFQQNKRCNSRFYTYINLSCTLRLFYTNILERRYSLNIVSKEGGNSCELQTGDIERIYLGDTRHIAMINIIAEGGTPVMAMLLAGHSDIEMSSHYYANISTMIECQTYSRYMALISGNEQFIVGSNAYAAVTDNEYMELENGARCYSKHFHKGEVTDCLKAIGDNGEIGYCYNCSFFRKDGMRYFIEDDNIYKSRIEKDSQYLKSMLERVRKGIGYEEEIREALLRLQSSTVSYEKYYFSKLMEKDKGVK
jgi:hypothetical protein